MAKEKPFENDLTSLSSQPFRNCGSFWYCAMVSSRKASQLAEGMQVLLFTG